MIYKLIRRMGRNVVVKPVMPTGPSETVTESQMRDHRNPIELNHARHGARTFFWAQYDVSEGSEFHVREM